MNQLFGWETGLTDCCFLWFSLKSKDRENIHRHALFHRALLDRKYCVYRAIDTKKADSL